MHIDTYLLILLTGSAAAVRADAPPQASLLITQVLQRCPSSDSHSTASVSQNLSLNPIYSDLRQDSPFCSACKPPTIQYASFFQCLTYSNLVAFGPGMPSYLPVLLVLEKSLAVSAPPLLCIACPWIPIVFWVAIPASFGELTA